MVWRWKQISATIMQCHDAAQVLEDAPGRQGRLVCQGTNLSIAAVVIGNTAWQRQRTLAGSCYYARYRLRVAVARHRWFHLVLDGAVLFDHARELNRGAHQ